MTSDGENNIEIFSISDCYQWAVVASYK